MFRKNSLMTVKTVCSSDKLKLLRLRCLLICVIFMVKYNITAQPGSVRYYTGQLIFSHFQITFFA